MNCRLDVQKYLNRQVKTVVNNLGSFDDSGFAYVTKDFNVNNLREIKDLNSKFKFKFLEHKKSDNPDLPDYVQMNLPDELVQHYINKYNKEQVVDNNQIKPGVSELFESNPELANAVYEALGFKTNITQDNKSYYRGQIEEPTIDKDGNLILYAREDELYKRAGLESKGVSMTDDLQSAIEYGNGQLEVAQNLASESYDAERELERLSENGYYLIQIPKNISNEIVKEAGEVKVIGDKIIIPKGQYKIEQVIDGVDTEITPQQKQQAQQLYAQYLEQNPNGNVEGFKNWVDNNQSNVQYQLPQNREIEEFVASEKTIRDLAARMSDRIGIPVKFESDRTKKYKGKLETVAGFNHTTQKFGNITYAVINLAYATLDTPIHEILGHPIIRAIKNGTELSNFKYEIKELNDPNAPFKFQVETYSDENLGDIDFFDTREEAEKYVKSLKLSQPKTQLYQNLLKELEYGKGKEVFDRIKKNYRIKDEKVGDINESKKQLFPLKENGYEYKYYYNPKLDKYYREGLGIKEITQEEYLEKAQLANVAYTLEEQQEEAIVELLGLYTTDRLDKVKDGKLISLLKRLLKEIKAFMKQLLGQKEVEIDKLPDNMTLGDIADLLAYSNSKLILPGNEVVYTTPDNRQFKTYAEASKHISELAKSVEDVDLSNLSIRFATKIEDVPDKFSGFAVTDNISGDGYEVDIFKNSEGKFKQIHPYTFEELDITDEQVLLYYNGLVGIKSFIEKNKPYEQSKEIIEEWKRVNNIQYNPEEVYSRGQGFYSAFAAYSDLDLDTLMANILHHIEDNEKAGGKFVISAFTKPIDKTIRHIEKSGLNFVIFPKPEHILWAANADVYSGSVWDASEKISKDKKSELLGVSYTKYPLLQNTHAVQPNLASIIDDLAHHHNELGIQLTGNNFRLEINKKVLNETDGKEYYKVKAWVDKINSILDQKYGKLVKPEIKQPREKRRKAYAVIYNGVEQMRKDTIEEAKAFVKLHASRWNRSEDSYSIQDSYFFEGYEGIQPTQTNETLKESIESVKVKYIGGERKIIDEFGQISYEPFDSEIQKEYTEQALINLRIAKLKEVAKKYPRSLIRSEVRPISSSFNLQFSIDELPFQKVSNNSLESFDLSKSDIVDNKTEELYPYSGLNEIDNENKTTSNKEIFFGGKTSISANEALKNAIDADIFQSNDKVAFFLQRLMNLQDKSGATVKIIDKYHPFYEQFTENVVMLFNSTNNMIYATEESLQNFSKETIAHALVHEIVHSTTIKAFIDPKTFEERDFRDFILKAFEQYKHLATLRDPNGKLMYGFTNPVEFIAEVYSNPDFRAELESIEKNWIQKFFDLVRRLIGLKKDLFNDGLIKTAVLFDVVDYFSERDVSEWEGTLVRDPRYDVYGLIAKKSEIPKIDSLDSKLEELINTQLNNLEGMRRRAAAALRKGTKKSDTFLKNVEKVADEVEKYMNIDKLASINNYADFMIDQINHISQTLKENPSRLEMLDTIERYRSYLGASDLYKSIMDTLTDVRLKDLPKEQVELAEEILTKLENIGGKHSRIISLFKNYTVDNLRKELSKTSYNSKVLKDFENELLKNYPKESGISRREWLNQELHKPENREILQQRIDADINDVLDGLSADISAWDRFVYSSLSTKSRLIQIVQKIIASAQSKITEAVRLNDIKLNKLYKDLVKEKGKYDISNLLDKDSDGKTYLKGQYSAEFRRLFNDEYAPYLDKLQSIIAKHGRNITKYTKDPEYAEVFDKVQAFRNKHMIKYGNKWIPSDKYKNNLKFSKAEQAIYDEYLNLVESSTKLFNNKESLVKHTAGVKYYELPYRTISDVERVLTNKVNVKDTLKQKKSEFLDWKIDDIDQYEKAYDSMGNEINHIPVLFRNRLTKAKDKNAYLRSIKEQSTDLLTLMRFEHLNQTNYKIKSENEVTLSAIVNVAKEKSYYKTEPGTSNVVKNFFGKHKKYVNLEGESNEYKRLKSIVNQHLYNVFKEQGFKVGGKDINKIVQSINKHTAFLGMSINYFQAPVNVLNAEFQNFLLKIGKDIDNNTLAKAHLEYSKELPMILKDTVRPVAMSKVNQLNLMMDIWGGFNESQNDFIKNSILKNYASTHTLQVLQNGGEHLVQSVLNIAILMSIKVMNDKGQYIDKDGNVVSRDKAASLYDMAKVDKDTGEVKFEGFTYTDKSVVTKWNEGGFENVKLYIKHKVHMTMGEYDRNYQNEAQRYWFFQLLFMFKKYLIPLGLNRYRGGIGSIFKAKEDISEVDKHWNEALQDYEEGFYITFGRFLVGGLFKDGLANSLNQLKWDIYRQKWEDLSDYEKGNIRKAIAELGVIVLLNTVVVPFLMASAAGDDDDTLWYLALMGRRLDQELSQYLDISEAYKVTRNPIASLNMIEDLLNAVKFGATPTAWFAQDQNDRFIATKIAEKLVIPSSLRVDKNSKNMLNYMNRDLIRPYKETMFYQIFSEEN